MSPERTALLRRLANPTEQSLWGEVVKQEAVAARDEIFAIIKLDQISAGAGGRQRRSRTGGAAKGIPPKAR